MKKKIWFLLAAVVLLLAGCGSAERGETTETARQPQTHATTEALPKFRRTTLVDSESCLFRVESIDPESHTLRVRLENRTDRTLMFSWSNVSVNGYMCDLYWAATVNAGAKTKEKITFSTAELSRSGIEEMTDIAFTLSVYDDDDWTAPRLVEEAFTLYPHGEALARDYPRMPRPGDTVLFDSADCAMTITGFDPENAWGYTVKVYLENRTEDDLMFSLGDTTVNGYPCDPCWAVTVAPGKRACSAISWLPEDFAAAGINRVEQIALPVRVYKADSLTDGYLMEKTFLLTS